MVTSATCQVDRSCFGYYLSGVILPLRSLFYSFENEYDTFASAAANATCQVDRSYFGYNLSGGFFSTLSHCQLFCINFEQLIYSL